jgi:RNA polymerase sigma factor (sigma-70 family)
MTTSIAELLDAATQGDQAAWNALVAQYNSLVWSIARSYRLADADAADAVQMTWLRLVENLGRINDPDRLGGWLATTARRECLQLLRKGGRERPTLDDQTALQIADSDPPLDTALLLGERDSVLWQAFTAIGEKCQRLLRVLMATPPPSYAEASLALDMPVGSIGPTRQRCLNDLRRIVLADESLAADLREELS